MVANTKPTTSTAKNTNHGGGKGKKRKYLPNGRPVKKGWYPLHPGVEGFFITSDGGRERQATNEALNLLDTFYGEIVNGEYSNKISVAASNKPLNKKIKFEDSDSSDEDEDGHHEDSDTKRTKDDSADMLKQKDGIASPLKKDVVAEKHEEKNQDYSSKKQRVEAHASNTENVGFAKPDDKPIDELIDDELKELGDRNKRRFVRLDAGCNGVSFIKMHRQAGDPGPAEIVHQMMTSAASSRKHMSRFILRLLPAEVTCYASEEEILKAIKPLIDQHFPTEAPTPRKFAVLYEARANTGIDRMKIINAVAKSVPLPHKVDLSNPEKTIIVQIAKTICMVGIVEKYKELSKYNLRQLTSPQY